MTQVQEGIILDPKLALSYMIQPRRSTVTLRSAVTGVRFTFQIMPQDKEAVKQGGTKNQRFWVKFLCGQNNESDYRYLGQILNGYFSLTKKSRESGLSESTPCYKAFQWAFSGLILGKMPEGLEVIHCGKCARCGRKLTDPESVKNGFGPECIQFVSGATAPCPMPEVVPVTMAAPVAGTAAPQRKLDFNTPTVKVQGVAVPTTVTNVGNIDAEIRRRIALLQEDQETYTQDGELDAKQAFNVAYNKFRVEIERERA